MPIFEFDTGTAVQAVTGSTFALNFTDNGANFTVSTAANPNTGLFGFDNEVQYVPLGNGGTGELLITDTGLGTMTLGATTAGGDDLFAGTGTAGNITLNYNSVNSTVNVTFVHATNAALNQVFTITDAADGGQIQFAAGANEYSEILFTTTTGRGYFLEVTSLTASITCYLAGTGIATPKGRVAVEDLQPGDQILTADGGTTTVNWLGIRPIDTATATPAKANPICFVAGSLAPNVPSRDLFVSPDHAMDIDGILYNATALVNGRSIYQLGQMPMGGFTYYHIDTGTHELVLAEGAASETYLDAVGRDAFTNGHEAEDTPIIHEMRVPRIVAKRMVPSDVTAALSTRADALGMTMARKVA